MLLSYLIVSLRELWKSKGVNLLKLLGLSLGFVCAIPVLMHLRVTYGVDRNFPNAANIYRLVMDFDQGQQHVAAMTSSAAYGPALRQAFPEIAHSAAVRDYYGMFTLDGKSHFSSFVIADPEFIDIFSLQFIAGDPTTALSDPFGIVLSESVATRLFPGRDPLGNTLTFDEMADFRVTGVVRDVENSHFKLNMLTSVKAAQRIIGPYFMANDDWGQFTGTVTYLAFNDAASARKVADSLPEFVAQRLPLILDGKDDMRNVSLSLEPLRDVYLSARQVWGGQNPRTEVFGFTTQPRAQILVGLSIFAVLILATACVNFISMSLSQLQQRQPQAGIRRTFGARSRDILAQSLVETVLCSLFALALSLPFV